MSCGTILNRMVHGVENNGQGLSTRECGILGGALGEINRSID